MTPRPMLPPFPDDQTITVRYVPHAEAPGRPVRIDYGTIAHEYITRVDAIDVQRRSLLTDRCQVATGLDPAWVQVREAYSQLAAVLGGVDTPHRQTTDANGVPTPCSDKPTCNFEVTHDPDGGFTVVKPEADPKPWTPTPGESVLIVSEWGSEHADEIGTLPYDRSGQVVEYVGFEADEHYPHTVLIDGKETLVHEVAPAPEEPVTEADFDLFPEKQVVTGAKVSDDDGPEPEGWAMSIDMRAVTADPVHSPSHYTDGGIETIDYLEAKLSREEFVGFCRGNALKYLSRAGKKGDAAEDFAKAAWYCDRAEKASR